MAYNSYGGGPSRAPTGYYNPHPSQSMAQQYQQPYPSGGGSGNGGPGVYRNASTASSYPGQQQRHQARPAIPPCPPGVNQKHWSWFHTVDTDRSGQISPKELQQALINGDHSQFDLETIKMLFGMFDLDGSGTIGFNEFVSIFDYVEQWQGIFRRFDADRSGTIEANELAAAMQQFQYNLSPRLISLLCKKYGSIVAGRAGSGGITFDRFVRCCVSVKSLTDAFMAVDTDRDGWASISYEQFLDMVLSVP